MPTIKESCLDRLIPISEDSLRRAIREFMTHYHHERNHQAMGNMRLFPAATEVRSEVPIACRHDWVDSSSTITDPPHQSSLAPGARQVSRQTLTRPMVAASTRKTAQGRRRSRNCVVLAPAYAQDRIAKYSVGAHGGSHRNVIVGQYGVASVAPGVRSTSRRQARSSPVCLRLMSPPRQCYEPSSPHLSG